MNSTAADSAADGASQTAPDWDAIKKQAEAEKAAIDAQAKLIESRKALEAAQAQPDPSKKALDDSLAAAKAAKDLADAAKAAADARKAQADSELAALKAKIGDVPTSGYTGAVELKDKAGTIEASLLAAKAVKTAAADIVAELPVQDKATDLLLFAAAEFPTFQALTLFRAQLQVTKKAFADAQAESAKADAIAPAPAAFKTEAVPLVATAGLALDAINKILGYFRTDYSVGGVEVALDDSLLIHALAGPITASDKKLKALLPVVYNPVLLADPGSGILNEFTSLALLKIGGQERVVRHDKLAARFSDEAGKEPDSAKKADLTTKAQAHKAAADSWRAAIALSDTFFSRLTTVDDKGVAPLVSVVRDAWISDKLKGGALALLATIQKSGGADYTEKNMWTFLGGMPFYNMGGAVVSFVLLDGATGVVLKSGVMPVHGGYVRADAVAGALK